MTVDDFFARLAQLRPDLGGTARLDMTGIPRSEWRRYREAVEAHHWAFHTVENEKGRVYWVLKRPGTPTVSRRDPYFLRGPSLAELRQYPRAREAAEQANREYGVDPLSDAALREVRARHLRLYRKAARCAGVAAICGIAFLVVVITAWRQLGNPAVVASGWSFCSQWWPAR